MYFRLALKLVAWLNPRSKAFAAAACQVMAVERRLGVDLGALALAASPAHACNSLAQRKVQHLALRMATSKAMAARRQTDLPPGLTVARRQQLCRGQPLRVQLLAKSYGINEHQRCLGHSAIL